MVSGLVDEIVAAREELASVAPDQWYDRLERDDEQLQASLRALREADPERGLEVVAILWPFWVARGRLFEGRAWLDDFLVRADALRQPAHRAKALYGAGVLAFLQGESTAASERLRESLTLARGLGDRGLEADALVSLARVAMFERDPVAMEARARESAEAARAGDDERKYATALHHVAEALRRQGRYDEADPLYREAIERHRSVGDRRSVALELHNLGRLERLTGDRLSAAGRFRESLALAGELRHERLVAYCLLGLANLAADDGDLVRACELIGAADARLAAVGAALEPEYADDREETLKRAAASLGEGESARAYGAGRGLAYDESVRLGATPDAQPR